MCFFLFYLMYLNMNYSAFSAGRNVQYQREDYNRDFKHVITMNVCKYLLYRPSFAFSCSYSKIQSSIL